MERPPELGDLAGLEARLKAWVEHSSAMYDRADREYTALLDRHCAAARAELDRWAGEHGQARSLLDMVQRSLHGAVRER